MKIKTELDKLTEADIYSLMLFALYKSNELPEYSSLSQLSYILDKDNLLKLCEYYGGTTIRIPTVKELEELLNALLLFQLVDVENRDYEEVIKDFRAKMGDTNALVGRYCVLKDLLSEYKFNSGRDDGNV
jgi:hypothetical protein